MRRVLALVLVLAGTQTGVIWGQPGSGQVQAWFEQGNLYLSQGLYKSARREYEKVLDAIPPQQRPATLQRVARCYYLQGKLNAAVIALKRAALLAPNSDVTRQLLTVTMENLDRGEEAHAWLTRLDTEGPGDLAAELGADPPEDELQFHRDTAAALSPEPATAHRSGTYRTRFLERSPLSSVEIYQQRYEMSREGMAQTDPAGGEYDLASETFEIFVPDTYDPAKPAGLLVWISPASSGGLSRSDNLEVLAKQNLIWIGANNSGNDRWHWYRTGLALDAAHNMAQLYNIDPERVYVGGYSGGGRVASSLAVLYPEIFQGGAFFYGCNYFRKVPVPGNPDAFWRAGFPRPSDANLKKIRKRNRYVFVTGEHDFNRDETEANFETFRIDRFQHITYLEIPEADHGFGVHGEWLRRVIEALDEPLRPARNEASTQ